MKYLKVADIKDLEQLAAMRHARNVNDIHDENLTWGDKVADKMADFAGSWTFIICFAVIMLLWIGINSIQLFLHPFDPFPFILLNLVLSCLAAIQAPVIMMSQNRQEAKDRIRSEHDYEINLKAEILVEEMMKRLAKLEDNQRDLLENQKSIVELLAKSSR